MTKSSLSEYLAGLEARAAACRAEDYYLWPRTVIGEGMQRKIEERVGVSDLAVDAPRSRPAMILRQIAALQRLGTLPRNFSVLDIACGDAVILWQIKKAYPTADCFGVDIHKDEIPAHAAAQAVGVHLYRAFIQHLFAELPSEPFDLTLMLNTYRGWESADLRPHESHLPRQADAWFGSWSRYAIVTATGSQIEALRRQGFTIQKLGQGEDRSTMICFSKLPLPSVGWRRWLGVEGLGRQRQSP